METTEMSLQRAATIAGGPSLYSASNGRFDSLSDAFNMTFELTFNRLKRRAMKNSDYHIPLDILRATAQSFAEICQGGKANLTLSGPDSILGKSERHRHNLLIHSLLQHQLDSRGMAKTDVYVCAFSGIDKSKLTKSKNKLQKYIKAGDIPYIAPHDRIPSFVYQFLINLGIDTQYTDVVVELIRRADRQIDMVRYRTCQDNSKVVGAICLVMRQANIKIPHTVINERCEHISKSTYYRWITFADVNRRRFNPILVKHRIRPIPVSFASPRIGRDLRVLIPMPKKFAGLYIGW
jgi:hypothetical protein